MKTKSSRAGGFPAALGGWALSPLSGSARWMRELSLQLPSLTYLLCATSTLGAASCPGPGLAPPVTATGTCALGLLPHGSRCLARAFSAGCPHMFVAARRLCRLSALPPSFTWSRGGRLRRAGRASSQLLLDPVPKVQPPLKGLDLSQPLPDAPSRQLSPLIEEVGVFHCPSPPVSFLVKLPFLRSLSIGQRQLLLWGALASV